MDNRSPRVTELKQALLDFVLEAEGELATALETFSAEQLTRSQQDDLHQRELVVNRFAIEGRMGDRTPMTEFLQAHPELPAVDRDLVQGWSRGFVGLFAIRAIEPDGFELMNWTTAKRYTVKFAELPPPKALARLKPGDILLAQIVPLSETDWVFFSPWISLGRLGKPKLAVAIGNFRKNYKSHLYSDAPDLLAESWASVERYHDAFVEFFGSDEVTLSGHEMGKRLTEFQAQIAEKNLEAAGIDRSKSLADLAHEAGVSQEELADTAAALGVDAAALAQAWNDKVAQKMMTPSVELPPQLKQAEQVTALSHPRWGQLFSLAYDRLQMTLKELEWGATAEDGEAVHRCLRDATMNAFLWHRLADRYPQALESLLQQALDHPGFQLSTDLDPLLTTYDKSLEPELPEIASVPLHLHLLFQDAVLAVSKDKAKKKKKVAAGFQRSGG